MEGINYLYIKKNGLFFVFTTRDNVSPSLGLELLTRLTKLFKDYLGILSEESIRTNFILVYELLDEIIDFGYPQVCHNHRQCAYRLLCRASSHAAHPLLCC